MCWLGLIILYVHQLSIVESGNSLRANHDVSISKNCNVTTDGITSGYKLNCIGLGLWFIPSCHTTSVNCSLVTQLLLANNLIKRIPNMAFHSFPNLLHLDLSNNPIGKCENGSFRGLRVTRVKNDQYNS